MKNIFTDVILPKILLVDDDESILKSLAVTLEREGFEIFSACNGKAAEEYLKLEKFVAVITDMNMPGAGGLELLKTIRNCYPTLPAILMTGFTAIIEAKTALDHGAKVFLAKPFTTNALMQALRSCGVGAEEVEPEAVVLKVAHDFCRINIDQFVSGRRIKFEIFICLAGGKYLKIAHTGEDIDIKRIRAFKSKGVEYLYIKKQDFAEYVGFNIELSSAAKNSSAISLEKKLRIMTHANSVIMDNLMVNGITSVAFDQAKEVTKNTIAILCESPECFDLLSSLSSDGDHLFIHSLGVSIFGVMVAKKMGWQSPATQYKISMAGLFHDIGVKEIDPIILRKPRFALNSEEVREIETHSARSVAILSKVPKISNEILMCVMQHHESSNGYGYPAKLSRLKIMPMARLISIVDQFCDMALAGENIVAMPAQESIDRLTMLITDSLDLPFLEALREVLGLELPMGPANMAQ